MSFLRRVAGRSLRDRVRSSVIREELGVEPPLLLRIERSQLRWLGHLAFRMPPGRLPREVFQACPTGRRPRGRPRTRWRDYVSRLAWERLGDPPGRAGGSVWVSVGGELLTSTGDIVGRWKEILRGSPQSHLTRLPPRKRRLGTLRWTRPSPQAEVTEVVRNLLSGKVPGEDEYLKSLDVVGLSWLKHTSQHPGKVYARVLERRIQPIVQ
ncbi:hypothetical protein L3Q82_005368 [Scortum barcoo]|uniref:Uncharacterized protein n=1 Tax=Scortum barcoo TaxID=214431 RepID=A0ACB8VAZ8_9TELE|nr:hypothetical protein L3Q82_005368 [Scortum barcoo]